MMDDMVVDGKRIAEELIQELQEARKEISGSVHLAALLVGEDLASIHYLKQKAKAAARIGVTFEVFRFPEGITTAKLCEEVLHISREKKNTGVIIQLPLPRHIESKVILDSVPREKDVDVLSESAFGAFVGGKSKVLPPVVGAIEVILKKYEIDPRGKSVCIVGVGRLVGIPSAIWFSHQGAVTCIVGRVDPETAHFVQEADILVAGSGRPRSITSELVKDGAVVLDAGYEVVEGKPVGDVEFERVAPKASLITPVPGGIGPITVAILFKNLLTLAKLQNNV